MRSPPPRRRAGLLVPLFSCVSSASWGIGDIGDLDPMTAWAASAGQRVLQLLPINEMAPGQQSPYSAISAMAIDPIFIHVPAVREFVAFGGIDALDEAERLLLDQVRRASSIDHVHVRTLKRSALGKAFDRFMNEEWSRDSRRARALKTFLAEQAWWVEDYALFRAIHVREHERPWMEWPAALQRREPAAVNDARRALSREVLFQQYLQWIADTQWRDARARTHGVELYGDLPFMVDADSADVWARQEQFRLDVSVGAPPDAFSATGQDWQMPVYRWDAIEEDGFLWLRARARRSAALFDGCRIDHVVGFYRTYGRPRDGSESFFSPGNEPEQTALGERVLAVLREAGSTIIVEDLGTVPDFVRASLARHAVPGFRVLRWERHWHAPTQPFRDPTTYPPVSVATSGTHDTEPLSVWWGGTAIDERRQIDQLPVIQQLTKGAGIADAPFDPAARDVLLEALFASGSDLLLLPVQDVFGWRDRINEPATVNDRNWTFRLPWLCDRLDEVPEANERQTTLRAWAIKHGRL
jgi:4-alpha-glucanotransferase